MSSKDKSAMTAKTSTQRSGASLGDYFPDGGDSRVLSEVAVVMPTVVRPEITRALHSIYSQDLTGRIQVVIGIDVAQGDMRFLRRAIEQRPENVSVIVLHLPFSTSVRHGGVHLAMDGGALRSILSFLANSRYVAYLDDDNIYLPDHLSSLLDAVQGKAWAASKRLLVDAESGRELGVDIWDSVGPGQGRFAGTGGFVDTNCLLVDKVKLSQALSRWSSGDVDKPSIQGDKNFFRGIAAAPHTLLERASVRYLVRRINILYQFATTGQPPFPPRRSAVRLTLLAPLGMHSTQPAPARLHYGVAAGVPA